MTSAPEVRCFVEGLRPDAITVVTDTTVAGLHRRSLGAALEGVAGGTSARRAALHWVAVTPGEESKTLARVESVLEEILPYMTRDSLIVAFGGGAAGNLAGTVAALLYRGTRFLHVPTTFMAQADSAIGVKQAVNARQSKNAFGAYHTPLAVFDDVAYLDTLPVEQWRNGVAESIKVAVARDPDLVPALEATLPRLGRLEDGETFRLLERAIDAKLTGLADDPHERNTLLYLEIGHTVGHAIERATDGAVPHGQAIALGMLIETQVAIELGISNPAVYETLRRLFRLAGLPTALGTDKAAPGPRRAPACPVDVATDAVVRSICHDNRRVAAGPLFVFAESLGHTRTLSGVDLELVRACIEGAREGVAV